MATKSKSTLDLDNDVNGSSDESFKGFGPMNGMKAPSVEAIQKGIERAAEMNKENMGALVESITAATKGLEVLGGESMTFAKLILDEGMKASKAMMAVKSPQEFMTLHNEFTRSIIDQLVNQATKVNDLGMTAMKGAYAPINERVATMTKAVQKARAF